MKNQERKKHPLLKMANSALVDLPTPTNISYMWNMGSLLGICLMIQIMTGLILAASYSTDLSSTFQAVARISRDIPNGFMTRLIHMNTASLFFLLVFIHMGRGLYNSSPSKKKETWASGMAILLVLMGTAFLGYVLPWGQMSFWGATVITNFISAVPYVGKMTVEWMWGGFSVSQPTLTRFFMLHFLLPLVMAALAMVHLMSLHETGSSNPSGTETDKEKSSFHPHFSSKDFTPILVLIMMITILSTHLTTLATDPENFSEANPLMTPKHIQPEWYFLFSYAILRSIPSKLGGVLALAGSIFIMFYPMMKNKPLQSAKMNPTEKTKMWVLLPILLTLTWVGANPVEQPYDTTGVVGSLLYFTLLMSTTAWFQKQ